MPAFPQAQAQARVLDLFSPTTGAHIKRPSQACIPCRRRKVRCDLGPVDNPTEPPCARCRREGKDCHFSATRRKRTGNEDNDSLVHDEYTARNGRKRVMTGDNGENTPSEVFGHPESMSDDSRLPYSEASPSAIASSHLSNTNAGQPRGTAPLIPYSSIAPQAPIARHDTPAVPPACEDRDIFGVAVQCREEKHVTNQTAAAFLSREINNPGDALHLLFEAAGRSGDLNRQDADSQNKRRQSSNPADTTLPSTAAAGRVKRGVGIIDPAITDQPALTGDGHVEAKSDFQNAIKAWSRLRFVRAGWFTAREAMWYIDYFYEFLAPLTPITPPDFRSTATHPALVSEEPVLAVTILTIASRYMMLRGPGGVSRSFTVHTMLWTYLRGMIERLVWGQEQFGGGFCGAGADKPGEAGHIESLFSQEGPRKGGLRALGTLESLLLLTEWHPRALHFPPSDDENELLVPVEASKGPVADPNTAGAYGRSGETEVRPVLSDWLEPAWRSDRMCWMLLFNALALAFELGVFNVMDKTTSYGYEGDCTELNIPTYRMRVERVRRLLFIYVTQTSGRLGWTSPMSRYISDSPFFRTPGHVHLTLKEMVSEQDMLIDKVQLCWMEITTLMKRSNELLFPSRDQTRETIRSGRYLGLLETFQPLLRGWRSEFDKLDIPNHMRHILLIEYEYSRLYINSLALQAVVERWTSSAGSRAQRNRVASIVGGPSNGMVSMATLLELYRGNEEYIGEVIDASRNILRVVVDGLLPGDYLKHTPVRTYFRVLSGAMFLLKTFALGAKEDDVALSLSLMDRTIEALRTCVVDDVHLSIRIGDLLETLTSSIRTKFVRLAANNGPGYNVPSRSRSPMPASARRSPQQQSDRGQGGFSQGTTPYLNPMNGHAYAYDSAGRPTADALAGIATESIDPTDTNVIFMPPPDFSSTNAYGAYDTTNNYNQAFAGDDTGGGGYMADWLALPLDPLLNSSGQGVSQGTEGFGPDVGNFDMLDILLNDHYEYEGRPASSMFR
ncbi:MAG: hypothetical protein M1830_004103 [Pleopsidium flavum]|nr:MAG: hypothetical protein M1830_004103 [Pleopsidium flavum]